MFSLLGVGLLVWTMAVEAPEAPVAQLRGQRPVIRGVSLFVDGRPVYLIGVWIAPGVSVDPRLYKPAVDGDLIYYRSVLNAETAVQIGLNSAHPQMPIRRVAEPTGWFTFGPQERRKEENLLAFLRGFGGLPLTVDYAAVHLFGRNPKVPRELLQQSSGWHQFVPLCPEHPDGWRLYEAFWRDGARRMVEIGAHAIIYELFNEPAYNCRCAFNKRTFAARMRQRYGTIERANAVWGTDFANWEAVAHLASPEATPGLWCDWVKFLGDRYVEILRAGMDAIREVDTRRPLYFLDQPSVSTTYLRCNGIDPVKVAATLDIVGMEGGVSFGEVADSKKLFTHQLHLDMARSFGKPVVNTETYCGRHYRGVRFPSHRTDILTELWEEMVHGASGSYFYNWGRRWWEWNDLAGAKKCAREMAYKGYSLLNPYAYPPEALQGFKDFARDLSKVGDLLLSGLRIRGTVALLISPPTIRQVFRGRSYGEPQPYEELVRTWYAALTRLQYPVDVVWEEQLSERLFHYSAAVAPGMDYIYPQSASLLARFAQTRLLLSTEGAFHWDEYGRKLERRVPATFLSTELRGTALEVRLEQSLRQAGIKRTFRFVPADGQGPLSVEAYEIVRDGVTFYYACNWETLSRLTRLQIATPPEEAFVTAPLEDAVYVAPEGRARWTAPQMRKGILVHLPAQTRVLIAVGWKPPPDAARWDEVTVRERYIAGLKREKAELEMVETEFATLRKAAKRKVVSFGGPTTKAGEYRPDEHTVLLIHANGTYEATPGGTPQVRGEPAFHEGKFGTLGIFVGKGQQVAYPLPRTFEPIRGSFEVWVKPSWIATDGKRHTVVELKGPGDWNQNLILLHKNLNYEVGFVVLGADGKGVRADVPINIFRPGVWVHLCGTWDEEAGIVRLYVDGQLRAEAKGRWHIERLDHLFLGSTRIPDRWFEGVLDEARLSNVVREPKSLVQAN